MLVGLSLSFFCLQKPPVTFSIDSSLSSLVSPKMSWCTVTIPSFHSPNISFPPALTVLCMFALRVVAVSSQSLHGSTRVHMLTFRAVLTPSAGGSGELHGQSFFLYVVGLDAIASSFWKRENSFSSFLSFFLKPSFNSLSYRCLQSFCFALWCPPRHCVRLFLSDIYFIKIYYSLMTHFFIFLEITSLIPNFCITVVKQSNQRMTYMLSWWKMKTKRYLASYFFSVNTPIYIVICQRYCST